MLVLTQSGSCILRRNPSGNACRALDLINHISCMYFLSLKHAKHTVPHHKRPQPQPTYFSSSSKDDARDEELIRLQVTEELWYSCLEVQHKTPT